MRANLATIGQYPLYRLQQVVNVLVLMVACLSISLPSAADERSPMTVGAWLEQAEILLLSERPGWLALLHYKGSVFSGHVHSQADDDAFFLHAEGATDAAAELRADIRGFFAPYGPDHAQCLFPARWWWLKKQLSIPDSFDVHCPLLDEFMRRISSDRLYLVFPSMYLNNPGSTFGHTFLRFDDADGAELLSQTLNYSARVSDDEGFISYVGKGLLGGYQGYFRARPYFEMVQEYSNIDNRDIWQYRLDFSAEEIRQLVRHVWEVKGVAFDYYFLRENCSYRLLALLDVVRPTMALTGAGRFPVYAIPVDTVRALDEAGLIIGREFRPSLATLIDSGAGKLGDDYHLVEQLLTTGYVSAGEGAADEGRQTIRAVLDAEDDIAIRREVLDTSYFILQFDKQASSARAQDILAVLNTLPADTEEENDRYSERVSPEKGHASARVATGYGEQNGAAYIDLRFRPAFHDLLDARPGFIDGASINVLSGQAKWFEQENDLHLENFSLVNVTSLSPISRWRIPLSWQFDFRFDRARLSAAESVTNFTAAGAAGISVRYGAFLPYMMATGEWQLSREYDKGHSIMTGVEAGSYIYPHGLPGQFQIELQHTEAVSGFELGYDSVAAGWQLDIAVDHALRMQYRLLSYDFFDDEDWVVDYNFYF